MKKLLLAGVAALFLATGTVHAAERYEGGPEEDGTPPVNFDICYEAQGTPENFLTVRTYPTAKSNAVWALREGDIVYADNKTSQKGWIQVAVEISPRNTHIGWVYKKYIKKITCPE